MSWYRLSVKNGNVRGNKYGGERGTRTLDLGIMRPGLYKNVGLFRRFRPLYPVKTGLSGAQNGHTHAGELQVNMVAHGCSGPEQQFGALAAVLQRERGGRHIQAVFGTAATSFSVRAEKDSVYTVTCVASDKAVNKTAKTATITMPHDQSGL